MKVSRDLLVVAAVVAEEVLTLPSDDSVDVECYVYYCPHLHNDTSVDNCHCSVRVHSASYNSSDSIDDGDYVDFEEAYNGTYIVMDSLIFWVVAVAYRDCMTLPYSPSAVLAAADTLVEVVLDSSDDMSSSCLMELRAFQADDRLAPHRSPNIYGNHLYLDSHYLASNFYYYCHP
jgi:hypothetical protein